RLSHDAGKTASPDHDQVAAAMMAQGGGILARGEQSRRDLLHFGDVHHHVDGKVHTVAVSSVARVMCGEVAGLPGIGHHIVAHMPIFAIFDGNWHRFLLSRSAINNHALWVHLFYVKLTLT